MNVNGNCEGKRSEIILVFNAGSSSLKFTVYDAVGGRVACRGQFDYDLSDRVTRCYESDDLGKKEDISEYVGLSREESVCRVIERVRSFGNLVAVGHRVVHGRERKDHTLVTEDILSELGRNIPLAPLHQPHNLHPIQILRVAYPDMPQVACFDTVFHRTQSSMYGYALPAIFENQYGIKPYGFHGLSYESVSRCDLLENRERTVVCHLGNGASICWMRFDPKSKRYQSVGCTLGYSTMDGLPMGTRIGHIDPGVVLCMVSNAELWGLAREGETSSAAIERILLKESGLLGVSGVSSDMAKLLDIFTGRSTDTHVKQSVQRAIQMFVRCVASEIARATVDLGGLDQIVFTAGIGENAWRIRRYVCDKLQNSIFSSLRLDETLNARCVGGTMGHISREDSGLRILVVPTDENSVIFEATRRIAGVSRE